MTTGRRAATALSTGGITTAPLSSRTSYEPPAQVMERSRYRLNLTPEEKAERRLLQYKLYQRRHRAKLQDRTAELELEVCQLAETVAMLNGERRRMLHSQRVFHSRGTIIGAPAKITNEFIRVFADGYVVSHAVEQEQFLRCIMVPNVVGPDFEGIDQLMEQMRLYSQVFARLHCPANGVDVSVVGETTVVTASIVLSVYPHRNGVLHLFPNVRDSEEIIQVLLSKVLHVPGKLFFMFDRMGACTGFVPDFDFVAALQRALGCLMKVNACLQGANIAMSSGKISLNTTLPIMLSERHQGNHSSQLVRFAG
jgi:hypothetical protein